MLDRCDSCNTETPAKDLVDGTCHNCHQTNEADRLAKIQGRYERALAAYRATPSESTRDEYRAAYAAWLEIAPKQRLGCEGRRSLAGKRQFQEREAQRLAARSRKNWR